MTERRLIERPRYADPEEVGAFAENLPDRYLHCRELGHLWRPFTAAWDEGARAYERVLRCSRCRTERHQTLSAYGAVVTNAYHYPDGYQHVGFGRITGDGRDRLRLESLTRAIGSED